MTDTVTTTRLRDDPDRLLTLDEFAEFVQVPVRTARKWISEGHGPRRLRCGRYVRIRAADVITWMDTRYAASA